MNTVHDTGQHSRTRIIRTKDLAT